MKYKCPNCKHDILEDATEIYDEIHAIEARKGDNSLWPQEDFRHEFKGKGTKGMIYGLSDGSIFIKSAKGKKLWKKFTY